MPRAAKELTVSIQVFSDDTNLDAYQGEVVWTRDPDMSFQDWKLQLVKETPSGTGIYTIESTAFPGKCLEATAKGGPVRLQPRSPEKLSQLWMVGTGIEQTPIENNKFRALVLTAHGPDTEVTLTEKQGEAPNQVWTLYEKK
ncbi:RICIN domain-containing protein [Streptomyces sp. NPDC021622]|uniref:RICIN domain-containing protein n=1 Tax=Streptomyces sp. NPDC021622 TaxID=3155013 RepID=UPI00340D218C